jgi:hypothetical protein
VGKWLLIDFAPTVTAGILLINTLAMGNFGEFHSNTLPT